MSLISLCKSFPHEIFRAFTLESAALLVLLATIFIETRLH